MKLLEEVLARDVGLQSQLSSKRLVSKYRSVYRELCMFFSLFIDSKGSFPNVTD